MTITLYTDPLPLRVDETGTIRIGPSRVTLDVLLADYFNGISPEAIVRELDTLKLADVHGAIAYYWRHQEEIDEYLRTRRARADELRRKIEAEHPDRAGLKAMLLARLAQRNGESTASSPEP